MVAYYALTLKYTDAVNFLRIAAVAGSSSASYYLAFLLEKEPEVKNETESAEHYYSAALKEYPEALEALKRLTEKKVAQGFYFLGLYNQTVVKNLDEAARCYYEAFSIGGLVEARVSLCQIADASLADLRGSPCYMAFYYMGQIYEKVSLEEAADWYFKGAVSCNLKCFKCLQALTKYSNGYIHYLYAKAIEKGVFQEQETVIEWYLSAAKLGSKEGKAYLREMLELKDPTTRTYYLVKLLGEHVIDRERVVERTLKDFLKRKAAAGDLSAQYYYLMTVNEKAEKTSEYYELQCKAYYELGSNPKLDEYKFLNIHRFLIELAENKIISAQYYLALLLDKGKHYHRTISKKYISKHSQANSATWYYEAILGGREEARVPLKNLAEIGYIDAQYYYARLLLEIDKDKEEARIWYERAAKAGHSEALGCIKSLVIKKLLHLLLN